MPLKEGKVTLAWIHTSIVWNSIWVSWPMWMSPPWFTLHLLVPPVWEILGIFCRNTASTLNTQTVLLWNKLLTISLFFPLLLCCLCNFLGLSSVCVVPLSDYSLPSVGFRSFFLFLFLWLLLLTHLPSPLKVTWKWGLVCETWLTPCTLVKLRPLSFMWENSRRQVERLCLDVWKQKVAWLSVLKHSYTGCPADALPSTCSGLLMYQRHLTETSHAVVLSHTILAFPS